MAQNKPIILRIQSPDGTRRIEITPQQSLRNLHELIRDTYKLDDYEFVVYKERNYTNELAPSKSKTISQEKLKHGDMLYMKHGSSAASNVNDGASTSRELAPRPSTSSAIALPSTSSSSSTQSSFSMAGAKAAPQRVIQEDDVDNILYKRDGRIDRGRDSKLCRHNSNGCCVHCSPIEPWDESYLKEQKIKHLSFHAYLRKLTSGVDRGKFVALDDVSCKIKSGCKEHPPWPKGICSKCQPSAITLNRQVYRHVDNVMFENPLLVERFLNYWRCSGHQRMGLLYGTYEENTDVPLGIRARVAAIYEPPQESSRDYVKLLDDENAAEVDEVARDIGLRKVGWIFTDLISDVAANGTVKHLRGIQTHFLTSHECIMAGNFQNQHPNTCKHSSSGYFGSKFVTVCVTGDENKRIHMEGYSVSAQCMALVRDNCLIPTKDASELGYIKESSDKQFVPDVYYKEKDIYGNEVSRLARPLPVEYLLVDVPASTPKIPLSTFTAIPDRPQFPVENRLIDGHLQNFHAVCEYLSKWNPDEFFEAISDFHLLIYLTQMDMLPIKAKIGPLLDAIRSGDKKAAVEWQQQEVWRTMESLIEANGGYDSHLETIVVPEETWNCETCTYINHQPNTCEICGSPRIIN